MNELTPIVDDNGEAWVTAAENTFLRALKALEGICEKLESEEFEATSDVKTTVPGVVQATQNLLRERNRMFELHKTKAGIVNDYAIDFDTARAEIGRRLSCLRAAGGD